MLQTKSKSRPCRQIELQPFLAILLIERVEISEVHHRIIIESVSAEILRIRIQHNLIATLWNKESIIRE